jgi:hypothetical protein
MFDLSVFFLPLNDQLDQPAIKGGTRMAYMFNS